MLLAKRYFVKSELKFLIINNIKQNNFKQIGKMVL